jgi:predicted permease
MITDIKYVLRQLRLSPWFTVGALLTSVLGLGVNVAMFVVSDRVLFRPLPFDEPERLVTIQSVNAGTRQAYYTLPKLLAVQARSGETVIADVAFAGRPQAFSVADEDSPSLRLVDASYNVLDVLGVAPLVGRTFTRDDAIAGSRLALVREEVWRTRFGKRDDIVGVRLSNRADRVEIIGVLPKDFVVPSVNWAAPSDGLILSRELLETSLPGDGIPAVFGRLREGVTPQTAQARLSALMAGIESNRQAADRTHIRVRSLRDGIFWSVKGPLLAFAVGAMLVWLVACLNLGSLMVARAQGRHQQLATLLALGATRRRIARLVAIEGLVLTAAGGAVALLMVRWTVDAMTWVLPEAFQRLADTSLGPRVVALVLLGVCLGTFVAIIYPGLRVWKLNSGAILQGNAPVGQPTGTRNPFLVAESAMATVLLLAGLLASRSFLGLVTTDLGFDPVNLYALSVDLRPSPDVDDLEEAKPIEGETRRSDDAIERIASTERILDTLRAQAGVIAASAVDVPPASQDAVPTVRDEQGRQFQLKHIHSDYFSALRTTLVAGRSISAVEARVGSSVGVLNLEGLRLLWPGTTPAEALGRKVTLASGPPVEIVGIVSNSRVRQASGVEPELFLPPATESQLSTYLVRVDKNHLVDVRRLASTIRREHSGIVAVRVTSVIDGLEPWLQHPRFYAAIFGSFGGLALVLSVVGLLAVVGLDMALRARELGIRIALGATSRSIQLMLIRRAVGPVALGSVVGCSAAYWFAGTFQPLLHLVDARDPSTYAFVAGAMSLTATLVAWRPTRRGANTDLISVMRRT